MKSNILHIITGLDVGGAERSLYNLSSNYPNDECKNYFLSVTNCEKSHYFHLLRSKGFEVYSLEVKSIFSFLPSLLKLFTIVRKINPDLIQGWMYHGNFFALIAKFLAKNSPFLLWNVRTALDSSKSLSLGTKLINVFLSKISFIPDKIIYNSKNSIKDHTSLGYSSKNSILIHNGFDCSKWIPSDNIRKKVRQKIGISLSTICFVYVGRNHEQKNLPLLFGAFEKASLISNDIALICIGKDLDKEFLAKNHAKIIFLGASKSVESLLPAFDVFCLSSNWEGFPNVIGEAMSCGLPCITTDVGDSKYIVGSCGWTVQTDNEDLYFNAILEALKINTGELKALKKSARNRILNNFTMNQMLNKYSNLYSSLLESS
jgi:glycosyltransferase involved in cell wall biosynthesis